MVRQRAAGIVISADRALPGFVPAPGDPRPDVIFHLGLQPSWSAAPSVSVFESDDADASAVPVVRVARSRNGCGFRYADGTRAWIDAAGANVWCTWPSSASLEDTCTYLAGPVLSLLLRIRGELAFHASAVQVGDRAIAFAGPHGAGKSTLAAALAAAGCPLVTDDVLHVRVEGSGWMAEPFVSMLKLWPDGAALALGAHAELPAIAAGWDKRALRPGGRIAATDRRLPLAAIACLAPRGSATAIERMSSAAALVQLAANSAAAQLLDGPMRAAEFGALTRLVRVVPCVSITAPSDPSAFPHFAADVLAWARATTAVAASA